MSEIIDSRFKQIQKHRALTSIVKTVIFSFFVSSSSLSVASDTVSLEFNRDTLAAVSALYGISEDQAIERLARETEAAINLKHIQGFSIESYAGAWFDESNLRLKVAIADPIDVAHLKSLDVDPVYVSHSLKDLQKKLGEATSQLRFIQDSDFSVANSYIDFQLNKVVLGVKDSSVDFIKSELNISKSTEAIKVVEDNNIAKLSVNYVRGADGTINENWQGLPPQITWPCSIGASIEDGYVTAGHCGDAGHTFTDSNGTALSTMQDSTWFYGTTSTDSAYADTTAAWTPSALINGYSDGQFSVSAEWAGMLEYPVGSTVCRYGQTSGGPHCGTVNQLNFTQDFGAQTVTGLTRVSGSCSDDGDSGGPHVAGTGQIQGTNTGVIDFVGSEDCPNQALYVFFMPIKDTLDEFGVTMLTTHGANAPTITNVDCPDNGISAYGLFTCLVNNVDSQGEVSLQWTSSIGGSSTETWFKKRCTPPSTITVTLQATNSYGTDTEYYTFPCPTGSN